MIDRLPFKRAIQNMLARISGMAETRASSLATSTDASEDMANDQSALPSPAEEDAAFEAPVTGYYDGLRVGDLHGWAWRVEQPDRPVEIEVYFDGTLFCETMATIYRPDLRAANIGHGRYGWRVPLPLELQDGPPVQVTVRSKGGPALTGGEFMLNPDGSLSDAERAECDAFVAAVLGDGGHRPALRPWAREQSSGAEAAYDKLHPDGPGMDVPTIAHFLLYCPVPLSTHALGLPEYSYAFVLHAFAPLLEKIGTVHIVSDAAQAIGICENVGATAILLSFAPPHRTIVDLPCPVIPVVAWEFPTIPTNNWHDADERNDWRLVLLRTGRAIALSHFAAAAIRATMGGDFPAVAIPAPVWDRFPDLHQMGAPLTGARLTAPDFIFDTRGRSFAAAAPIPPIPTPRPEFPETIVLDGVVFTSVFNPSDHRKNWVDIVSAFLRAHRDHSDATLILKMISSEVGVWWWELHDLLNSMPPFTCRLLVVPGFLPKSGYEALIASSHWVVNASLAEGLCLPLLEFMTAGRPAITPAHTAMTDYITPKNALIVASDEESCAFPHDPDQELATTRHNICWASLVAAFSDGYRLVTILPDEYAARSFAARETMRAFCSDAVVAAKFDSFLKWQIERKDDQESPSALLAELARP